MGEKRSVNIITIFVRVKNNLRYFFKIFFPVSGMGFTARATPHTGCKFVISKTLWYVQERYSTFISGCIDFNNPKG